MFISTRSPVGVAAYKLSIGSTYKEETRHPFDGLMLAGATKDLSNPSLYSGERVVPLF